MISLSYAHIWPQICCYTSPQAVFILKYVCTTLIWTPPVLVMTQNTHCVEIVIMLSCSQSKPHHFHNSFFFFLKNLRAHSDFWESRPSLNTSWHHWMIKLHGWLRPEGNWDQRGQLQDRKGMSQHPKDRNNR